MARSERDLDWASDVRPSMPVAPTEARAIRMGGFAFTTMGLAHDISATEVEELAVPPFAPARFPQMETGRG